MYSNLRWFLNNEFLEKAFTDAESNIIPITNVDNSVASTGNSTNAYACDNTEDKIFALSRAELTNTAYGFDSDPSVRDVDRSWLVTDYGKATNAYCSSTTGYVGTGYAWSRSPLYNDATYAYYARDGRSSYSFFVGRIDYGVVPALNITL